MGERLRTAFTILSFLFAVALLNMYPTVATAQIAITDSDRFEVSFSRNQTNINSKSIRVSVNDLENILGSEYAVEAKPWTDRTSGDNTLIVEERANVIALNRLRPANSPDDVFTEMVFTNSAPHDFEGMVIAFDFLYQFEEDLQYTLQLNYRINSNRWKEVSGGVISSELLRNGEQPWNSFSVQSRIDEMYMKRDDTIEFAWTVTENETGMEHLPLAIQQIEINPVRSNIEPPASGSIVITEILPSDAEGPALEFIELYNPTDKDVNLKGLEVITTAGQFTVQENVAIAPYQYFVLSNETIEGLSEGSVYIFTGSLFNQGSGTVELYMSNTEVARAAYDINESGRSVELGRVASARNGFSASQNFVLSENDFNGQINASPGVSGATGKLYSRSLENTGWYLVSAPGLIVERSQQPEQFQMYSAAGDLLAGDEVSEFTPFLIYRDENDNDKIYSEQVVRTQNEGRVVNIDNHSSILSIPVPEKTTLGELTNVSNQPMPKVMLHWNETEQSFKLIHGSESELAPWSSVIVNNDTASPVRVADNGRRSAGLDLERYIKFRYFEEESSRRERLVDEGLLGFMDNLQGRDNRRYDLPKFYPLLTGDDRDVNISLMHLSNPLSEMRTNSYTHLPFELDRDYQLPIGITTNRNGVQGIIEWSEMENIPEEWVLTFEDRRTGVKVDMREETRYRFRYNSQQDINIDELAQKPFNTVRPNQEERFVVTLKPFESALETGGNETTPGSVELRKNYPNPFNPATNIVYYLPEDTQVRISIYNVVGQQVAMLVDDNMGAGEHTVNWNAAEMPSGIYIIHLETGNRIFTRKITLIK